MKLATWIAREGLTRTAVAKSLRVTVETVSRYCNGERTPRPALMAAIVRLTRGQVTANDFVREDPAEAGEAA